MLPPQANVEDSLLMNEPNSRTMDCSMSWFEAIVSKLLVRSGLGAGVKRRSRKTISTFLYSPLWEFVKVAGTSVLQLRYGSLSRNAWRVQTLGNGVLVLPLSIASIPGRAEEYESSLRSGRSLAAACTWRWTSSEDEVSIVNPAGYSLLRSVYHVDIVS
jgi:hypothetical protein